MHLDARIGFRGFGFEDRSELLVLGCLTRGEGNLKAKRKMVRVFSACVYLICLSGQTLLEIWFIR